MITVVGPEWPSKKLLEETIRTVEGTEDVPNTTVAYGAECVGALNGCAKVNGLLQLQRFANAGLNAPETTIELNVAVGWLRDGHDVWGRKLYHTHGKDIVGFRHPQWHEREFWVKVVPNVLYEWRLHVFLGRCIARGIKWQTSPPWRKLAVRNRSNGWTMRHDIKPPDGLRDVAKKAVAAVGYDFGAVDLLVQDDGTQWVLEVNKAPGMDDYTANAYAKAIVAWAKNEG